jgi:hypothetical protein
MQNYFRGIIPATLCLANFRRRAAAESIQPLPQFRAGFDTR